MQIREKFDRVARLVAPAVKSRVRQAIPDFVARTGGLRDPQAICLAAMAALRVQFPLASPAQADLLAFYLLSVAATIDDGSKSRLDSMNEMSELTSMRLQMAMDRRSKFVEALSNIMKKIESTQETIVQNLKG